jgi:hypothetical protein
MIHQLQQEQQVSLNVGKHKKKGIFLLHYVLCKENHHSVFVHSNIELVLLRKKKKPPNIMTMRKGLYDFPAVSYFSSCWLCAGNKREKLWQEFFSDPSQWWDNRFKKVGERMGKSCQLID